MNQNEQDNLQKKERQKNPIGNLGDSINRAMVGDMGALAKGGCLTKIITVVIIFGGFFILSRCSY